MLRNLRTRRRSPYGAHICALSSALLLLLSVTLLYTRLLLSPPPPHPDPTLSLIDDLNDSDYRSNDDLIDTSDVNSDDLPSEDDDDVITIPRVSSTYFYDHRHAAIRRAFNKKSIDEWEDYVNFDTRMKLGLGFITKSDDSSSSKAAFGSDDFPVDVEMRMKMSEVRSVEDVLLLKGSPLREGWGEWFEKKSDFLRRDRMFKSNLEALNPNNNAMLQDPDGVGVTGLNRGDKIVLKGLVNEFKQVPFLAKKPLSAESKNLNLDTKLVKVDNVGNSDGDLGTRNGNRKVMEMYADGKRWGYFPGLKPGLSFNRFMDSFFEKGKCSMRVFMVWNSPAWMFTTRYQRGLESVLKHHRDACVVVFSETIELNFFSGFVKDGFRVAVVMPNLDELLQDTPTHIFASVWYKWKQTKHYPLHYSELIRLAALYKYGGIYLDSDIIVLNSLSSLNNTVGFEDDLQGKTLNGAVMAYRKDSPFIMECLKEFYASYDDSQLRWNGADLLTRVASNFSGNNKLFDRTMETKFQPSFLFFPIGLNNISRYFSAPATESEKFEQNMLFKTILEEAVTFHFWNGLTSAMVPEPGSLVYRIINHSCLHCSDEL